MLLNGGGIKLLGIAWLQIYQPIRTLPAGGELRIPLKPLWSIYCVAVRCFYS